MELLALGLGSGLLLGYVVGFHEAKRRGRQNRLYDPDKYEYFVDDDGYYSRRRIS